MSLRLDRDRDEDGIVLSPFDPARAMRGLFARRPGEQPEEYRGAEVGQNRGFSVETALWPHSSNIHLLRVDRLAEERVEVSNAGAEQLLTTDATAIGPLLPSSVNLCLWMDPPAGEGFFVSSHFLRNPLLAEEVVAWTGIGVDKLIRLQSAA